MVVLTCVSLRGAFGGMSLLTGLLCGVLWTWNLNGLGTFLSRLTLRLFRGGIESTLSFSEFPSSVRVRIHSFFFLYIVRRFFHASFLYINNLFMAVYLSLLYVYFVVPFLPYSCRRYFGSSRPDVFNRKIMTCLMMRLRMMAAGHEWV